MTTESPQTETALLGLRELILNGTLDAGEILVEARLVARLGVSRTPVRAALARLQGEGLLTRTPRGGYAVRSFALQDVADAIELRGTLEGMAARVCARDGIGRRHRAAMEHCLDQLDVVVAQPGRAELGAYIPLNTEFHRLLVEAAGSEALASAVQRVTALPFAAPSAFVSVQALLDAAPDILVRAQGQHRHVMVAIAAGDFVRAENLARAHAATALDNLEIARHHGAGLPLQSVPGIALVRQA